MEYLPQVFENVPFRYPQSDYKNELLPEEGQMVVCRVIYTVPETKMLDDYHEMQVFRQLAKKEFQSNCSPG